MEATMMRMDKMGWRPQWGKRVETQSQEMLRGQMKTFWKRPTVDLRGEL
jgi:hypothetical protein